MHTIIEVQYINVEADKQTQKKIYFIKGRVSGMPIGAEVCLDEGKTADALVAFAKGDKTNPSKAFQKGVVACIELYDSHFALVGAPRKYKDDDGNEQTSYLDTDKTIPVHHVTKIRGADETVKGWDLLKSIPFRASPVKEPAYADAELADLLNG